MIDSFLQSIFPKTPYELNPISQGTTSKKTYSVVNKGQDYILQILPKSIHLQRELMASEVASDQSIGANIIARERNLVLYEKLSPMGLSWQDLSKIEILRAILQQLFRQHQLPPPPLQAADNVIERCERLRFGDEISLSRLDDLQTIFLDELPVFIHGDLNHSNIAYLKERGVRFIDWTYAGLGCKYEDLAEIAVYFYPDTFKEILSLYFADAYENVAYQKLYQAWLSRLVLFARWALDRAKTFFYYTGEIPDLLQIEAIDITLYLQELADGKRKLDNAEKFIHFAASALQTFERHLRS